jgi:hypothetical protein
MTDLESQGSQAPAETSASAANGSGTPGNASGGEKKPAVHEVADGEHLSAIAEPQFGNFETVWNAPENRSLREARDDPHQLLPGDEVVLPKKRPKRHVKAAGDAYTFTVHVEKLKLRLKVFDLWGRPIAGKSGELVVDGKTKVAVSTDGDGLLTADVAHDCRTATLTIEKHELCLDIGALAPFSERSGQAQRLSNLGHWMGDASDPYDPDSCVLAIELFQRSKKKKENPTGVADTPLFDKLSQDHDGRSRQVTPPDPKSSVPEKPAQPRPQQGGGS